MIDNAFVTTSESPSGDIELHIDIPGNDAISLSTTPENWLHIIGMIAHQVRMSSASTLLTRTCVGNA